MEKTPETGRKYKLNQSNIPLCNPQQQNGIEAVLKKTNKIRNVHLFEEIQSYFR